MTKSNHTYGVKTFHVQYIQYLSLLKCQKLMELNLNPPNLSALCICPSPLTVSSRFSRHPTFPSPWITNKIEKNRKKKKGKGLKKNHYHLYCILLLLLYATIIQWSLIPLAAIEYGEGDGLHPSGHCLHYLLFIPNQTAWSSPNLPTSSACSQSFIRSFGVKNWEIDGWERLEKKHYLCSWGCWCPTVFPRWWGFKHHTKVDDFVPFVRQCTKRWLYQSHRARGLD